MLDRAGLHEVKVNRSHGFLSDHYNPASRSLALSESVHDSASIAAIGVATHEAGHAIQHARNYAPLWARSMLVPTASIGSSVVVCRVSLRSSMIFTFSRSMTCWRTRACASFDGAASAVTVRNQLTRD